MARKRMIDPSFWSDEKLGECTIQERYLFMGLISNADDEGYGRANPKLIRSLVFPYDDLRASDLEKWLSRLGGLGLIVLYQVNGQTYYYLPNFSKHQTINKPSKSQFPPLSEAEESSTTVLLREDYGSPTVALPPKRKEEKRREEKGKEGKEKSTYQLIADMYNDTCVSFPRLTVLSDKRKQAIKARLNTYSIEQFRRLFEKAEKSNFLKGANARNWQATFDWLIKDGNFAKVLDGNYDNAKNDVQDNPLPENGQFKGILY